MIVLSALTAPALIAAAARQDAAAARPGDSGLRLIRSTSGSKGAPQGSRYVIDDPRTVFSAESDRQVVVFFEWEALPRRYRCEGRWKDPTGRTVLVAPLEYETKSRRLGLYWSLALPPDAPRGLWALEVYADGQLAGAHTFEVAASAASAPGRPLLSPAEIYQRALAAVGTVEKLGEAGETLGQGPAVAHGADHVVTAFPVIESASVVRLRTATGGRFESREIVAWQRPEGWASLTFPGHGLPVLPRASGPPLVGDRCFVLDTADDGSRVIGEASVVGQEQSALGRLRLNQEFAAGSPVFDERGDLLGVVVTAPREARLGQVPEFYTTPGTRDLTRGALLVSLDRVLAVPPTPSRLSELAARGEFLPPLSAARRNLVSGIFAARVQRGGAVPMPEDQRDTFSRREGQIAVFVQWSAVEKRDALCRVEIYDADYKVVGRGEPTKVKLRRGQLLFTTWTFGIAGLRPAVYRFDLLLDDSPVWRGYLRVTE
jgi:hypothetical protein